MRKVFKTNGWSTTLKFESPPRFSFLGALRGKLREWLLLIALVLVFVWLLILTAKLLQNERGYQTVLSQNDALTSKITDLNTRHQQNLKPTLALSQTQIRAYNAVIRQLNIPWQQIFEDLERLTPPDVALISIEPDGARTSVKFQAEAKTLSMLLTYAAALQQQGVFGRITYSKHETNEQDKNKPVRLSFELALVPTDSAAHRQAQLKKLDPTNLKPIASASEVHKP